MDYSQLLAQRTGNMKASAIREILKATSKPEMVSLAGGIPAPESFPMDILGELTQNVLDTYGSGALQYDIAEGFTPLREALVDHLKTKGVAVSADEITVMSGSQGVLDAIGKILISKGENVAVEAPTYLGAISAFNPYEPNYVTLETDEDGLLPESLEEALTTHFIKFIYLVPTFQNPTGRTIPLERRRHIAELIKKYDALLIEDDPYSALRFKGEAVPPIWTFAPENVVYISTLSKVLAPGIRIGFCVAPGLIREWLVKTKHGADLHTNTFGQAMAAKYIAGGYIHQQLPKIISLYHPRLQAMLAAMEKHFPNSFSWSRPEGGMFVWAAGPEGFDAEQAYWEAVKVKTAFVPGYAFFTDEGTGKNTMRLNFTNASEELITESIYRLSRVFETLL
ncbi:MAG: PLP-dependent aminotransferase family protein [Proteobacteria bacterium]|nr:PLP-dependent aminotransferase family protein [Pseudomonadota bacterium]